MLNLEDIQYLEDHTRMFKTSFFDLISNFGPNYNAKFTLAFSDIKLKTGRERLTNVTLSLYEDYLRSHGFHIDRTDRSIDLVVNAYSIVSVGNEAMDLSSALREFRSRALMNGDVDNM